MPGISGGPAAVTQTDPFASTAMPPGDTGHSYFSPGPPQWPSRLPAASNSSTGRADLRARRHRVVAPVHDPDVILCVDGHARDGSEQPVIGERFRPQRIDLE